MTHDHRTMADGAKPCQYYAVLAHGAFIATRRTAQAVAAGAQDAARRVPGQPVTLDFEGVEAVTVAFADELVTALHLGTGTNYVRANPDVEETLQLAIARRRSQP